MCFKYWLEIQSSEHAILVRMVKDQPSNSKHELRKKYKDV